jgi:DNA repair protein RadC|nr:MAG TPA: DNA repair protein-like protein [Caudoviricetes sp.]
MDTTVNTAKEFFERVPQAASMTDLVSIILGNGTKGHNVQMVAREVVERYMPEKGYQLIEDVDFRDLMKIPGIGKAKALQICAAIELGRRLASRFDKRKLVSFSAPDKVAAFFMEKLRHESQEHFITAYVNVKNRLLGYRIITKGNLTAAPVDIKEALKWGIRYKAYGLILVHNHPSGFSEPSKEDIDITKAFAKAAKYLDMEVLDHIIIGDGEFTSLHESGIL